jgi:hypothetical protein
MGLNQRQAVITEHLYQDLNNDSAKQLNQQLADAAITLLKGDTLIKQLDLAEKTALVSIGVDSLTTFQQILGGHFDNSLNFILSAKATGAEVSKVANELKNYKQVIVALHDTRLRPQSKLNYSQELNMLISELASHNVLFNVFANPYTIASFPGLEHAGGLVVAYQNDGTFQKAAAKLLSGQLKATGKLPITINSFFKYGDGL